VKREDAAVEQHTQGLDDLLGPETTQEISPRVVPDADDREPCGAAGGRCRRRYASM